MSSTIGQGNAYIPHTPSPPPPPATSSSSRNIKGVSQHCNISKLSSSSSYLSSYIIICTVITEKLTRLHMLGSELNNWYFLVLVFLFSIFSRPIYIYTDSDREWLRWVDRDLTTGYVSNASCLQ